MSFCWFCHEVVNIFLFSFSLNGMGNLLWRLIFAIFISSKNKSLMKIIRLTVLPLLFFHLPVSVFLPTAQQSG